MKLSGNTKLALDTNVFIYALEDQGELGDKAREVFSQIQQLKPTVVTSILTVQEVLVDVYRKGLKEKANDYLNFITADGLIEVAEMDLDIAVEAASLRAKYSSLKTPDAIQLATALVQDAEIFITADKQLPKKVGSLTVQALSAKAED